MAIPKLKLPPKAMYALILLTSVLNVCTLSFDPSMINGFNSLPTYFQYFKLDSNLVGLNVAIVSAGSIVSAPLVGPLCDRWGRKAGMYVSSVIIIIGAIIQVTAHTEAPFVVGRFLIGFALAITGSVTPVFLMELASSRRRGTLVGALMACFPIIGTIVLFVIFGVYRMESNWAWKGIIFGEIIMSALSLCLLPFVPESPRWLIYKDRKDEAMDILVWLHGNGNREDPVVNAEFEEICGTIAFEKSAEGGWKSLISPAPNLKRFGIAILCNIFFQISGPNSLLFFLAILLTSAGIVDTNTQILIMIGVTLMAWASVSVGTILIEKLGRRPMFLGTTIIMVISMALLAVLTAYQPQRGMPYSIGAIAMIFIFQGAGCSSWMILAYSYPPEILKFSQRVKGTAAAQAVGYAFGFLNLYTTPIAIENIGWKYYALNASWNVLIVLCMWWCFVETKGRTLEEIDAIFEGIVHTDGIPVEEIVKQVSIDLKDQEKMA